ncbi:MAG: methyl-accepting chemotaxis protein, partial [Phycisphaerales bacterium]
QTAALVFLVHALGKAFASGTEALNAVKASSAKADELAKEVHAKALAEAETRDQSAAVVSAMYERASAIVANLEATAHDLGGAAQKVQATTRDSKSKAGAIANNANLAAEQMASVASASSQLDQSIADISTRLEGSRTHSQSGAENAEAAMATVRSLVERADAIHRVIELISDIAEQTNLLALNATIEAARAGDMGKGFAVVASEIKTLASETAKATESIGASVRKIHDDIAAAVASIDGIATGVSEVNQSTSIVAAAVEEQSVLMQGMSTRADELLESTQ